VTQFVAPFYSFIPGEIFTAFVPVDDYHAIFFAISCYRDAPVSEETRREREEHFGVRIGIDLNSDNRRQCGTSREDGLPLSAGRSILSPASRALLPDKALLRSPVALRLRTSASRRPR
jgi:hypothetical protein